MINETIDDVLKRTMTGKIEMEKEFLSPIQHDLLKVLEKHGPMTRRDLVKTLNTARTTVYDNLVKLQKLKQVEKFTKNHGQGRPLVFWKTTGNGGMIDE